MGSCARSINAEAAVTPLNEHFFKGKKYVQVGNSEKYGGSTDPRSKYGERPCRSGRHHVGRGDDE
jgi:hypothetical protein